MSKLGLHVHDWNDAVFRYCLDPGAAVIKSLAHNPMMVNEVKRAQPKALLVARHYVGAQLLDDPVKRAGQFTAQLLKAIDGCHYDAAEGYNEWDGDLNYCHGRPEGLEVFKRYADFEAERSRILHGEGLKSVVGGCSVGTPPEHWFSGFRPALEEGDFLHLHEYSAPRMWDAAPWHCLKYRHVYKYLEDHNLPMLPLIISECGIDGGVAGRPKEGWRKFGPPGIRRKVRQYMEDWRWMDAEWMKDRYVVGGCAYDCGSTAGMGWLSFNIDPEMLPLWATYAREQGVTYWEPKEEPVNDEPIRAIDVSEWGGPMGEAQWKAAYGAGFRLAIIQAWGGGPTPGGANEYCAQQLKGARGAGMITAIYLVVPPDTTTRTEFLIEAAKEAAGSEYQHIKFVAMDIEDARGRPLHPTKPKERLGDAISHVKDKPVVIYSSLSMWSKVMRGALGFEQYALWDARYDELAELDTNWVPYGGWKQRAMKQYKGTTLVAGNISADLNIGDLGRLGLSEPAPQPEIEVLKQMIQELEALLAERDDTLEDYRNKARGAKDILDTMLES